MKNDILAIILIIVLSIILIFSYIHFEKSITFIIGLISLLAYNYIAYDE